MGVFGRSWGVFWGLWEVIGTSWDVFWGLWEVFGTSWGVFKGTLGCLWESMGSLLVSLGGLWEDFGGLWEVFGTSLGGPWGPMSPRSPAILLFWTHLENVLGPFLDVLEGLETSLKDRVTEKSLIVDSCFRCRILIENRDVTGRLCT